MARRAHLLKVMVQTVWVVVDDATGDVVEQADPGVVVPAAEWPNFYERHVADFAAIQELVAAEVPESGGAGPNRAKQRAKRPRSAK